MARKSISDLIADEVSTDPTPIPQREATTPVRRDVTEPRSNDAGTPGDHDADTSVRTDTTTSEEKASPKPVRRDAVTSRSRGGATPRRKETTTSVRREATTSRSKDATKPRNGAPSVDESVALTVRFDPVEYADIDEWIIGLRRELVISKLDKSVVIRALLSVAREKPVVREALLDHLSQP